MPGLREACAGRRIPCEVTQLREAARVSGRVPRWASAAGVVAFAVVVGAASHLLTAPLVAPEALDAGSLRAEAAIDTPAADALLGVVVNSSTIELGPLTDGVVAAIKVRVGEPVKAGQVLVTFESAELEHELSMVRAEAAKVDAETERASVERQQADERLVRAERAKAHLNIEELSAAQYAAKVALAAERSLRAQQALMRAKVEQLKERVDRRSLKAPADGVVADRYVEPGTTVLAGRPAIRLGGAGGWRVRFAVPEAHAMVAVDDQVEVAAGAETFPAVVTQVAPAVDPATLTRFAEAALTSDAGPPFGVRVKVLTALNARSPRER